jgi:hypothetical protein
MPNKVKQRWIARQEKRAADVAEEAVVVEEVVEPTVVEGGTVTDVEVVDEEKPNLPFEEMDDEVIETKKSKKTKKVK